MSATTQYQRLFQCSRCPAIVDIYHAHDHEGATLCTDCIDKLLPAVMSHGVKPVDHGLKAAQRLFKEMAAGRANDKPSAKVWNDAARWRDICHGKKDIIKLALTCARAIHS